MTEQENYNYLDLLPHSPETLLCEPKLRVKHLLLYKNLISFMRVALSLFYKEKAYSRFDPHVGDTLCQTRAILVHYLASQLELNHTPLLKTDNLDKLHKHISTLINHYSKKAGIRRSPLERKQQDRETLFDFLTKHNLLIKIPGEIYTVILMYFLTHFKLEEFDALDIKRAAYELETSKDLAHRLLKHWQVKLSQVSTQFVISLSNHLPYTKDLIKQDQDGRQILPAFFVMEQLICYMREFNTVIELSTHLTLHGNTTPQKPNLLPNFQLILQPGHSSNYHASVGKFGVEQLLLCSTAIHPQYSSNCLAKHNDSLYLLHDKSLHDRYLYFLQQAKQYCHPQNPLVGYAKHFRAALPTTPPEIYYTLRDTGLEGGIDKAQPAAAIM